MLAAFDSVQKPLSCATLSHDNRLRLWDINTSKLRQQYVESNHLDAAYSCLTFWRMQSSKKQSSLGLVALGTAKGVIVIWQLQTGEVLHRLTGHTATVNDVVFNEKGSSLYSCSDDKQIIEWNVQTGQMTATWSGGKQPLTKLALSPDGTQLLSASSSIRLWDLSTRRVVKKFSGHPQSVTALQFSSDARYFLSGCRDRFVSVWPIDDPTAAANTEPPSKKSKKSSKQSKSQASPAPSSQVKDRTPVHTFALDSPLVFLQFHPDSRLGEHKSSPTSSSFSSYRILTVSDNNTVAIFSWTPSGSSGSSGSSSSAASTPADCEIHVRSATSNNDDGARPGLTRKRRRRLGTGLSGAQQKSNLNPALGQGPSSAVTASGSSADRLVLAAQFATDAGRVLVAIGSASMPSFQSVEYLNSDSGFLSSVTVTPTAAPSSSVAASEAKRSSSAAATVSASGSMASVLSHSQVESSLDAESEDDAKRPSKSKKLASEAGDARSLAERITAISSSSVPSGAPQAASLSTILTQALHTNDVKLLEYCLGFDGPNNVAVIHNTIDRLPPHFVIALLRALVDRFQSSPNRGAALIVWIKQLLSAHASYLMSVPDLATSLSKLYQIIDDRLGCFKKLLALSGRLDLLLSQVQRRESRPTLPQTVFVDDGAGDTLHKSRLSDKDAAIARALDGQDDDAAVAGAAEDDDDDEGFMAFDAALAKEQAKNPKSKSNLWPLIPPGEDPDAVDDDDSGADDLDMQDANGLAS